MGITVQSKQCFGSDTIKTFREVPSESYAISGTKSGLVF